MSPNFRENGGNEKKVVCQNLDDDKREQLKENEKIRKKQMRDKLDDNKKGELKNIDHEKPGNLDTHEKELLKIMKKRERGNCTITLMMTKKQKKTGERKWQNKKERNAW